MDEQHISEEQIAVIGRAIQAGNEPKSELDKGVCVCRTKESNTLGWQRRDGHGAAKEEVPQNQKAD